MLFIQVCQESRYKQQIMESSQKEHQPREHSYSTYDTTFQIKRLTASERVAQVAVNFPMFPRISENQCGGVSSSAPLLKSTPVFNKDRFYFTPCFVLESDLEKVEKNLNSYYNFHLNKINEMEEEKEQIYVPKPSKNHTFCGICRQHYDDYFTHVNDQLHQGKLAKAKIQKTISGFMKILQKKDKRIAKTAKPVIAPAKRGRPSKKEVKIVQEIENIPNLRSEEEGQSVDSQLLVKKEPQTISAGIVEPMSWVGQFLV